VKPNLSGTVITFNEAHDIADCIASLRRVCDDIVVVDSFSEDRTVEIARELGATVLEREFEGDGPARTIAAEHAKHDWVLVLDADERMDDEMCETVRALPLGDPGVGYAFNRKSFIGERWIDGPGFYPDWLTRLYNRTTSRYQRRRLHALVECPREERVAGHILHYTYADLSDWIGTIDSHSSLVAEGMFARGRPPSAWKPALSGLAAAFRQLITRRGIFRGEDGRTVAMASMFYTYMKYLKLNELHERED
jgi:glycosyltransferase involved in cell wall biosynthesis